MTAQITEHLSWMELQVHQFCDSIKSIPEDVKEFIFDNLLNYYPEGKLQLLTTNVIVNNEIRFQFHQKDLDSFDKSMQIKVEDLDNGLDFKNNVFSVRIMTGKVSSSRIVFLGISKNNIPIKSFILSEKQLTRLYDIKFFLSL